MAKHLEKDEAGTKGVQRILKKESEKALESLNGNHRTLSDEAVHSARKLLKRMRADLRLLREALGDRVYRRENARFRDAARPLTELRDARVLVDTLDQLAEDGAADVERKALNKVRRTLQARYRDLRRKVAGDKSALKPVRESLEQAPQRSKKWGLPKKGWSVLGAGLERVYRASRKAFASARDQLTVDNLHEWRKQAKYLRSQLEVLQPLWPEPMEQLADQAHDLTDLLGDDHDLAVLRDTLQDAEAFPDRATADRLCEAVDCRRRHLQDQAFALGARLFAEKPKAFVSRLKNYWQSWRAEKNGSNDNQPQ